MAEATTPKRMSREARRASLLDAATDLLRAGPATLSFEAIAAGRGTDILILDHHLAGETLPKALAVVTPNRQDEDGSLAHLCAAAVVFLVLVGLSGLAVGGIGVSAAVRAYLSQKTETIATALERVIPTMQAQINSVSGCVQTSSVTGISTSEASRSLLATHKVPS